MIILTDKAKEAIQEEIEFLVGIEEDSNQILDLGLILFVRKQSCSPMTEGGHLEIGVAIEPIEKYEKNENYKLIETLKEINNIPVFVENNALKMLGEGDSVEIDARGALEKELIIRDGPIKDLGSCKVKIKRK